MNLKGRHCVVVGSAPLEAPIVVQQTDIIIAVNGGISSTPLADVWVVNARPPQDPATAGWRKEVNATMLRQGAGRRLELLLLLDKGDGVANTVRKLKQQGTAWAEMVSIHNEERRRLEAVAGARTPEMQAHALSAGLFAASWCYLHGAETVRLEGFSWAPGYAYHVDAQINNRGHEAGDRRALALLEKRYPDRLIHSLGKDQTMAKRTMPKPAAQRPAQRPVHRVAQAAPAHPAATSTQDTPDSPAKDAKAAAREAVTPAAERARKVERNEAERAERVKAKGARKNMVRATELTYYGERRRRAGEVFQLREATDFRPSCMEWADEGAKETPRPTVATARTRMKPNAADLEEDDNPPAGRPDANNPLGV